MSNWSTSLVGKYKNILMYFLYIMYICEAFDNITWIWKAFSYFLAEQCMNYNYMYTYMVRLVNNNLFTVLRSSYPIDYRIIYRPDILGLWEFFTHLPSSFASLSNLILNLGELVLGINSCISFTFFIAILNMEILYFPLCKSKMN